MIDVGLSYEVMSQLAHILGGCWLVEHLGKWTKHRWKIFFLIIAYAAFKEFYIDANFESIATRGSDLVDFLFWSSGAISGLVLSYFR
jgi:hypothetical protein